MKNSYLSIISLLFVLFFSCSKGDKKDNNAQLLSVDVALPTVDSVMTDAQYPGYLTSLVKVDLVARVNGFLESINFKAGDYVPKGKILFVIEPKIYNEALAQAQAELTSAKSQKMYAQSNYQSTLEAARSNAVSQIDLIQAQNSLNQAIASIANCEAAVATARQNLSYCYVKAPISGQITKSVYDVGNYLNGGVSPQTLATLYDDTSLNVYFSITDKMYLKMVAGQGESNAKINYNNIPITFEEQLKHNYYGKLDYMSPNIELSTGTLNVRAIIKNPYKELKSGMYATVNLPVKEVSKAILVKDASIGTDQLGKYLFIVNDSNKVVYTPIKVGELFQDSLRIVISGIKPNQKYVTKALLKVRDGMPVNPILTK